MQIGLESYSYAYATARGGRAAQPAGDLDWLIDRAAESGLAGVSFPPERFLPGALEGRTDEARRARDAAGERGLFLNAATGGTDPERVGAVLRVAGELGCSVVRTVIGGAKIGGDRRPMRHQWQAFMDKTLSDLRRIAPVAEANGVALGIENHQDVTSDELLWLINEVCSPLIGVTLDVANPLATGEHPDRFYRKVMPYLKAVHLKDYTVHLTQSGYRLARATLGQGIVDFPWLLEQLRRWHPRLRPTVELAALYARHIRVLEDDFWPEYPPRQARDLARAWRYVLDVASPAGVDWRTPVERGEDERAILDWEHRQLQASAGYVLGLAEPAAAS